MKHYWVNIYTGEITESTAGVIREMIFNFKHCHIIAWNWRRIRV